MKHSSRNPAEAMDLSRSPVDIARQRAEQLFPRDPQEAERFMTRFGMIRIAELRGKDTYAMYREALELGDTALVAAHIEGAASTRRIRWSS